MNTKAYLGRGINNQIHSRKISSVEKGKPLTSDNITFLKTIGLKPRK